MKEKLKCTVCSTENSKHYCEDNDTKEILCEKCFFERVSLLLNDKEYCKKCCKGA